MKLSATRSQHNAIISILVLIPAMTGGFQHDHAPDLLSTSHHTDDRPHQHHDHPIRLPAASDAAAYQPMGASPVPATIVFLDLNAPVFSIDRPPETDSLLS